jgi:hypothetical protein
MPRVCERCRRVNPREAAYCYYDGHLLDRPAGADIPTDGSAVNVGARPFTVPLVLPSGRACHNFAQLALACHQDPASALDLLRKGHLETFLGGQGRMDLAHAARAAARAADRPRGLDDFLGRLPVPVLTPARLRAEPAVIDLGTLHPGEDRRCELALSNEGMRLLYGTATCEGTPWLSLGDGPAQKRKLFQVSSHAVLPLRVLGRHLRAYRDAQDAEVRLESNGGSVTVVVRVRVPVKPFPEGVLAGATTPRQLAARAHDAPREAAALLASGAVARWYEANGWDYPVAGPTAGGVAAVQQLFEALGLVKTPHVELSEDAVELHGRPGEALEYVLAAVTQENRAAVAHGNSDQPWLRVGPTIFRGRSAFVPLSVAAVPGHPGERLRANVSITANGNQRFVVPVTLVVGARAPAAGPAPAPSPRRQPDVAAPARAATPAAAPPPLAPAAPAGGGAPVWRPLLCAGLLLLVVAAAMLRDYLAPAHPGPATRDQAADPVPRLDIRTHEARIDDELQKLWLAGQEHTMRFGLVTLDGGKEVGDGVNVRRLTFDPWGRTNNTCLRFDRKDERLFSGPRGRWEEKAAEHWKDDRGQEHQGVKSVWAVDDKKVTVTQLVELVRGEQSRLLDTCRVRYQLHNGDGKEKTVGIRFLLDTYIGGNDGVPFTIRGDSALCGLCNEMSFRP